MSYATSGETGAPQPASTNPSPPGAPVMTAGTATPLSAGPPQGLARPRGHRKSPVLACLLSLLPGVGQVYVGYYRLGFLHNVIFASLVMVLSVEIEALVPLFGIFLAFFFIYNIVDAGRRAALYNLALEGVEGIELPDEHIKLPEFGGSLTGGVLLVVLGGLLLSSTLWGLSLDWIEDWWPVAPIALGVYLIGKALQERRQAAETRAEGDAGRALS